MAVLLEGENGTVVISYVSHAHYTVVCSGLTSEKRSLTYRHGRVCNSSAKRKDS